MEIKLNKAQSEMYHAMSLQGKAHFMQQVKDLGFGTPTIRERANELRERSAVHGFLLDALSLTAILGGIASCILFVTVVLAFTAVGIGHIIRIVGAW